MSGKGVEKKELVELYLDPLKSEPLSEKLESSL